MASSENTLAVRTQHVLNAYDSDARPEIRRLSGRALVPAYDCSYQPSVESQDVLAVDFDCQSIGGDGLYLIEVIRDGRCAWRGCRRFARQPGKIMMDESGRGDWQPFVAVSGDELVRVVGRVEGVYRMK